MGNEGNTGEFALSVKALSWAFDMPLDDPLAKLVLLAIANNHNEAHDIAWPSVAHLCRVTGANERTVQRKLAGLEDAGLIRRKYRTGRSTQYHLCFGTPGTVSPPAHSHPTPGTQSPITYKEPLKKKKREKIKIKDWVPSADDEAFARSKGHDPATILESIRLWDEARGNIAAYVNPSAFYRQWVNREKPPRGKVIDMPTHKASKHEDAARYLLTPGKDGVRPFDKLPPSRQKERRHHNPVLDRALKKNKEYVD
jgi:hypothetical protein